MSELEFPTPRVAMVTGCGQGLGLEVCRQLAAKGITVIATYRNAEARTRLLSTEGLRFYHAKMDVTIDDDVSVVTKKFLSQFGAIDILINNAGVYLDREKGPAIEMMPISLFDATLQVNLVGAARVINAVLPSMIARQSGVIVNVSSGMGRVVELAGNALYYRTSKAALTALTRCLADRVAPYGITVNAVCPGWVRSTMGGLAGVRSIEQGAAGIISAALNPPKSGALLRDGEDFGW